MQLLQEPEVETGGVGLILKYVKRSSKGSRSTRMLLVKKIQPGSSADASSLIVEGDYILRVNGKGVAELSFGEVAKLMVGPVGSEVKLSMESVGGAKFEETLVRKRIPSGDAAPYEVDKLRRKGEL